MTYNKIVELEWEIMSHPSHLFDLSSTDFHLFMSLDNHMRKKQFKNESERRSVKILHLTSA